MDDIDNFNLEIKGKSSYEYSKNRIRNDEDEKTSLKELEDKKKNK